MVVTKNLEDKLLNVKVEGRLDTATAPELEAELAEVLDEADELVFDLEGLEYMSSAGLRILLATQKKMGLKGGMKVTNVNDVIMEIFEITGFSDILTIE
ncbi:MAG: STAS domain-containing protein [Clostridiales bacterium]|jgi:anti-sigma B factor antagonist|nr:STAS domain-containing protein [Clostridiales bacterium]